MCNNRLWYFWALQFVSTSELGARWPSGLERWTSDQVVQGSNPAAATYSLRNFCNSVYPALPSSFGEDTKSCRSLLSGVYARGSKSSHQSALEMCNLSWTPPPTLRDHTSSWTTLEISLKTFLCYPVNMMCYSSKSNQLGLFLMLVRQVDNNGNYM